MPGLFEPKRGVRLLLALLVTASLGGCGMMYDADSALPGFTQAASSAGGNPTDSALAALAKGDYLQAETHVSQALRRNPRDPYALLAAGLLFQNTGRPNQARQAYQELLSSRSTAVTTMPVGQRLVPRSLAELANINMGYLAGQAPENLAGSALMPGRSDVMGVAQTYQGPPPAMPVTSSPLPIAQSANSSVLTAAQRFQTLRELAENGLVTQEEYLARRQANIGAILPLTQSPPGAGLDRPSPPSQQVIDRLRELGRSLERGAISPAEQNAERQIILDGLLPAQPRNRANPLMAPKDFMAAASSAGALERLKNSGLVTADEYAREREALDRIAQPPAPPRPAVAATDKKPVAASPSSGGSASSLPAGLKGKPAVHLASYKSREQAEKDIAMFKKKSPDLAKLGMLATKVDLGAKGTYWRLKAGPLASAKAAQELCRKLKANRQYCEPSIFE
ncbi:MAG: SPOR domain-containing protein [Alphaproteobacteria bacterium]|nr:SPOR domain-containing protein [Alphaproteobacteria bacterium]